jgi:signal peptidase II
MTSLAAADLPRRGYFLLSALIVSIDQITKVIAERALSARGPLDVIPGMFAFSLTHNKGGLFGYFAQLSAPWRSILLTALPLVAVLVIGWFLARSDKVDRRTLWGLGLILGGAVGNLIDRIVRGEVVDFLDVYVSHSRISEWLIATFGTTHWPTFNVADSTIVVGASILFLTILRPGPAASE